MNIGMVGMGKLGLPVALAIESRGHQVTGYDISPDPARYLEERSIPYQEEGLQPLLDGHQIRMTPSLGILVARSDILFVPVQTPHDARYGGDVPLPDTRKDFDYTYLKEAVGNISSVAGALGKRTILATISTCLPGTYEREIKPLIGDKIDYVYTPQFIAMGTVLEDYLHPEFNLIGVEGEETADQLERFYATINDAPNVRTDITTAEGIKVSYNTWITAKTVVANAWGELAHKTGMNFDDIKRAWDLSTKRIHSPKYTDSGVGDGGGCHPRDNIALSWLAEEVGMSHNIWEDLMEAREAHMEWLAKGAWELSVEHNLPIVILGRSFKPETNIETGSPAVLASNIFKEHGVAHQHYEDIEGVLQPAVYMIGTKHERYKDVRFPKGSVVLDPFRWLENQDGVKIIRIGKQNGRSPNSPTTETKHTPTN